jgi:hypothetical protein
VSLFKVTSLENLFLMVHLAKIKPILCIAAALSVMSDAGCLALWPQQAHEESRKSYIGFDRNDYPGDAALSALKRHFDFVGYWLTNPPGEQQNSWSGRRAALEENGFGFLVLANGKTDAEIKANGKDAAGLGRKDGAAAATAASHEGFHPQTVLFLDQEEGGRLLPEQADYLFAWTEAVAASGFLPGVYGSGQRVDEGHGQSITTATDIQAQVVSRHLHPIILWVYQDACPPSNGCTLQPPALSASGTAGADVWQYAQSPRRRENTAACAKTYAADGNCYIREPNLSNIQVDLSVATSDDPSHGR